jgi:protein SCO1/2
MTAWSARAIGLGLLLALAPATLVAAQGRIDAREALQKSEAAIGRKLGDYMLIDSRAAPLPLSRYRGKPLIISLVYTACSSVCPPSTQRVIDAVQEARRTIAADRFEVLTIGFDAGKDTPARLSQFANVQGVRFSNWRLASADSKTISALLGDLGFSYSAAAGGYDHVAIEPLKDVVYGTRTTWTFNGVVDRIKFICTTFDPGAGRYRLDYGLVFGSVIAAFSLAVMGSLILREWLRTGRA